MNLTLLSRGALVAIAVSVLVLVAASPAPAPPLPPCPSGMSGNGTSDSPCLVIDQADLESIASNISLHYRLTQNIDLTGRLWSPIAPYDETVGATTTGFSGSLDGAGFTIDNLTVLSSTKTAVGLFGVTDGASITNLTLEDATVDGADAVGALIGVAEDTTIDKVNFSGTVLAARGAVAGLVGYAYPLSGTSSFGVHITRSRVNATVRSYSSNVGGYIGVNSLSSTISDSLATGSFTGTQSVGGFIGTTSATISILNSVSTASLTSTTPSKTRGLVGSDSILGSATATFWDSAAAGTMNSGIDGGTPKTLSQLKRIATYSGWSTSISAGWHSGGSTWGICQYPDNATVPFLSWTLAASPCTLAPPPPAPTVVTGSASSVTSSTATLSGRVNPNDFDATDIGMYASTSAANAASHIGTLYATSPSTAIDDAAITTSLTGLSGGTTYYYWIQATNIGGTSYGAVEHFTTLHSCASYTWSAGGSGTSSNPYRVASTADLVQAVQCPTASFLQVADISLATVANWTPIGDVYTPFSGTYDGGNHGISNLTYLSTTGDYVGLFGMANGATFKNIGSITGSVHGRSSVAGLVGYAIHSTVSKVHSAVNVTGDPSTPAHGSAAAYHVGGLVGYAVDLSIADSSSSGLVTASGDGISTGNFVGGLVGDATDTDIVNSWATGDVTGIHFVGGLVGEIADESTISRSNASGAVIAASSGGGLVGSVEFGGVGPLPSITDSFATGAVRTTTDANGVGGLIGFIRDGAITRSYSSGAVSGPRAAGGFLGFVQTSPLASHSFWDTGASGKANSTGEGPAPLTGVTGEPTASMKQIATFSSASWDIRATCTPTWSVWAICPTINNGYPYLEHDPIPAPGPSPTGNRTPSNSSDVEASTLTVSSPSSNTSTSSPSAPPPTPVAPSGALRPGASSGSLNGQPITVNSGSGTGPNEFAVWGPGFSTTFTGVFSPTSAPRSSDIRPVLLPGSTIRLSGSGAKPGSTVGIFAFSEPMQLATLTADASGRYEGSFVVPGSLPLGSHALQVASWTPQDQALNVTVGVTIADQARKTIETVVRFKGAATKLSKPARTRLSTMAGELRSAKAVTVTCSGALPAKRVKASDRELAKARADKVCAALASKGVEAASKSGAVNTRSGTGLPRGSVRVTASQRITAS